jgi:phage tail-like protein
MFKVTTRTNRMFVCLVLLAAALLAAPARADEPVTAARFSITIDGYEIASFAELRNLDESAIPFAYVPPNGGPTKLMVRGTATLLRALTTDRSLWTWFERMTAGREPRPMTMTLVVYGPDGAPIRTFVLHNSFPVRLGIASLKSSGTEVAMEELTLVHGGIDMN